MSPFKEPEHNQISVNARPPPPTPPAVTRYSHNPKQTQRETPRPGCLLAPRSSVNRRHMAISCRADYGLACGPPAAMLRDALANEETERAALFSLLQPPPPKRGRRRVVSQSQQSLPSTADSMASCLTGTPHGNSCGGLNV